MTLFESDSGVYILKNDRVAKTPNLTPLDIQNIENVVVIGNNFCVFQTNEKMALISPSTEVSTWDRNPDTKEFICVHKNKAIFRKKDSEYLALSFKSVIAKNGVNLSPIYEHFTFNSDAHRPIICPLKNTINFPSRCPENFCPNSKPNSKPVSPIIKHFSPTAKSAHQIQNNLFNPGLMRSKSKDFCVSPPQQRTGLMERFQVLLDKEFGGSPKLESCSFLKPKQPEELVISKIMGSFMDNFILNRGPLLSPKNDDIILPVQSPEKSPKTKNGNLESIDVSEVLPPRTHQAVTTAKMSQNLDFIRELESASPRTDNNVPIGQDDLKKDDAGSMQKPVKQLTFSDNCIAPEGGGFNIQSPHFEQSHHFQYCFQGPKENKVSKSQSHSLRNFKTIRSREKVLANLTIDEPSKPSIKSESPQPNGPICHNRKVRFEIDVNTKRSESCNFGQNVPQLGFYNKVKEAIMNEKLAQGSKREEYLDLISRFGSAHGTYTSNHVKNDRLFIVLQHVFQKKLSENFGQIGGFGQRLWATETMVLGLSNFINKKHLRTVFHKLLAVKKSTILRTDTISEIIFNSKQKTPKNPKNLLTVLHRMVDNKTHKIEKLSSFLRMANNVLNSQKMEKSKKVACLKIERILTPISIKIMANGWRMILFSGQSKRSPSPNHQLKISNLMEQIATLNKQVSSLMGLQKKRNLSKDTPKISTSPASRPQRRESAKENPSRPPDSKLKGKPSVPKLASFVKRQNAELKDYLSKITVDQTSKSKLQTCFSEVPGNRPFLSTLGARLPVTQSEFFNKKGQN